MGKKNKDKKIKSEENTEKEEIKTELITETVENEEITETVENEEITETVENEEITETVENEEITEKEEIKTELIVETKSPLDIKIEKARADFALMKQIDKLEKECNTLAKNLMTKQAKIEELAEQLS